jgi:hypothetical protein
VVIEKMSIALSLRPYVVRVEFHVEALDEDDAEVLLEMTLDSAKDQVIYAEQILNYEVRETVRYRGRKRGR